jgi:hypothetical protein
LRPRDHETGGCGRNTGCSKVPWHAQTRLVSKRKPPPTRRLLSSLLDQHVGRPACDRGRKFAGLRLQIGGCIDEPGDKAGIGSRLGHLQQRCCCFTCMKSVIGHSYAARSVADTSQGTTILFRTEVQFCTFGNPLTSFPPPLRPFLWRVLRHEPRGLLTRRILRPALSG